MINRAEATIALAANTVYFALAAGATIYVVAEAWHYGFWFTPFPLLLSILALFFVAGSTIGALYFTNTLCRALAFSMFLGSWTAAAVHGSYLSSSGAVHVMLPYFLGIVILAFCAVTVLANRTSADPQALVTSKLSHAAMRCIALVIPLPILAYAALSMYANGHTCGSTASVKANIAFVQAERFLFGAKRADDELRKRAFTECRHGHYAVAEEYAKLAITDDEHIPLLCTDKQAIRDRLAARQRDLLFIYGMEGKLPL